MKIIIDIPKRIYERIRAEGGHGVFNIQNYDPYVKKDNYIVTKAIFNGEIIKEDKHEK